MKEVRNTPATTQSQTPEYASTPKLFSPKPRILIVFKFPHVSKTKAVSKFVSFLLLSVGLPVANAPDVLQSCGLFYYP